MENRESVKHRYGWFRAMRSPDALELLRANPNAFLLAYIIAYRARYKIEFNADQLQQGEALLGDIKNYGMTMREYRTAKQQLTKWRFATFRRTNKGTIGRLTDTRLFDPLNVAGDRPDDNRRTIKGQSKDNRATTNNKEKKEKKGKKEESLRPHEKISLEQEASKIERTVGTIRGNAEGLRELDEHDRAKIGKLNARLREINMKLRRAV